jgi:hypothetical protein
MMMMMMMIVRLMMMMEQTTLQRDTWWTSSSLLRVSVSWIGRLVVELQDVGWVRKHELLVLMMLMMNAERLVIW